MNILSIFLPLLLMFYSPAKVEKQSNDLEIAKEVYHQVNDYRVSQGLKPVKAQRELHAIAYEHSLQMARGEVGFSHDGFINRVGKVKKYARVPYRVAENLYAIILADRSRLAPMAVQGWIESEGHHKNMKGDFLFTGIGVARSAKGEYFITQIFVGKSNRTTGPKIRINN